MSASDQNPHRHNICATSGEKRSELRAGLRQHRRQDGLRSKPSCSEPDSPFHPIGEREIASSGLARECSVES